MPLLAALGKHVGDWPPYLSNLALELWRRPQGGHYVKARGEQEGRGAEAGGSRVQRAAAPLLEPCCAQRPTPACVPALRPAAPAPAAQVLYNRQPLPLTELCGSPECDLQLFK